MIYQGESWHHPDKKRKCWLETFNTKKFTKITILPRPGLIYTINKAFSPVGKPGTDPKCKVGEPK